MKIPEALKVFHDLLVQDPGLGQFVWNEDRSARVHRGVVPYQETYAQLIESGYITPAIPPYVWYDLRDHVYDKSFNSSATPLGAHVSLELVCFHLETADAMANCFSQWLFDVQQKQYENCFVPTCDLYKNWSIILLDRTDDYSPQNGIALDFGGFIRDYNLRLDVYEE